MGSGQPGHRPRKRFGQNFLTDRHVIDRIMQAIDARPGDTIAEIGPGHGALTEPLIRSGARLHVVELDRDLVTRWRLREGERLSVHAADALDFDFRSLAPPGVSRRAQPTTARPVAGYQRGTGRSRQATRATIPARTRPGRTSHSSRATHQAGLPGCGSG